MQASLEENTFSFDKSSQDKFSSQRDREKLNKQCSKVKQILKSINSSLDAKRKLNNKISQDNSMRESKEKKEKALKQPEKSKQINLIDGLIEMEKNTDGNKKEYRNRRNQNQIIDENKLLKITNKKIKTAALHVGKISTPATEEENKAESSAGADSGHVILPSNIPQ